MNDFSQTVSAPVSIAIPQLGGGGAEKVTTNLALLLHADGLLSRVYSGRAAGSEGLLGVDVLDLNAERAASASRKLRKALAGDPARTFLLTLGYVNLAPVLRVLRPMSRIVLRIGNTMTPELRTLGPLARLRYRFAVAAAARVADCIIVQSDYMGEDLVRHVPGVRRKLATAYNFAEDRLWDYQTPAEPPISNPYLFTAASFKPQKAYDVLLAGFARSDARKAGVMLVVAGVSPDHDGFAALMRDNGLGEHEVLRLGFIDPYPWIAHAQLCVLASYYEGFSNFLLESASFGKRIVATDCPGGNAELFVHYPNVVTVPVADPAALAGALGAERNDIARHEARKHLHSFEKDLVYSRYRALLLGQDGYAGRADAATVKGTA